MISIIVIMLLAVLEISFLITVLTVAAVLFVEKKFAGGIILSAIGLISLVTFILALR